MSYGTYRTYWTYRPLRYGTSEFIANCRLPIADLKAFRQRNTKLAIG